MNSFEHLTAALLNRMHRRPQPRRASGLLLGHDVESPHGPVILSDSIRTAHAVCLGKTGAGKTYFLESLALALAKRSEGFAFIDFHGDATTSLVSRLMVLPQATERLILLDPSHSTRSPGLNILKSDSSESSRFAKVSELSSILRQRWGVDSFGARTEELLRNSLYVLAASGRSLADLPRLLTDKDLRRSLTTSLSQLDIRDYWQDRYEPLTESMKAAFREPILNRASAFLTDPHARHLLGQTDTTIDFADVMNRKRWLLVRLPKGRLREHAHTIGNLVFAQLQFAAFARERLAPEQRHPFTIICDEVQNLAENDLATLITEGRKFGISVITANQFWDQLPAQLRACLLSAASHICFRLSTADARVLGAELSIHHRSTLTTDLTALDRGVGIARIGNSEVRRFRVPKLPDVAPLPEEALDSLIEDYTSPRSEIERRLNHGREPEPTVPPPTVAASGPEGHHAW